MVYQNWQISGMHFPLEHQPNSFLHVLHFVKKKSGKVTFILFTGSRFLVFITNWFLLPLPSTADEMRALQICSATCTVICTATCTAMQMKQNLKWELCRSQLDLPPRAEVQRYTFITNYFKYRGEKEKLQYKYKYRGRKERLQYKYKYRSRKEQIHYKYRWQGTNTLRHKAKSEQWKRGRPANFIIL